MKPVQRSIILHHHLFKNAGTSFDAILRRNFAPNWVTREFPGKPGGNGDLVAEWIGSEPQATAFSSHTMRGPMPAIPGVEVIPVIFLRDPIARIRSAYSFERQQQVDTLGSRLAREHDFEGYCRARLDIPNDRQCRDFHVSILAGMSPGPEGELERARTSIRQLRAAGVVGLVEDFGAAMVQFAARIAPVWPDFHWEETRANTSDQRAEVTIPDDLDRLLRQANENDLHLLEWARQSETA